MTLGTPGAQAASSAASSAGGADCFRAGSRPSKRISRQTYLPSIVSGAEQQEHLDVDSGVGDAAARRGHVADAVKLEEKVARHSRLLQFRAQARCSRLLSAYVLRLAARDNFANVIPAMHFWMT